MRNTALTLRCFHHTRNRQRQPLSTSAKLFRGTALAPDTRNILQIRNPLNRPYGTAKHVDRNTSLSRINFSTISKREYKSSFILYMVSLYFFQFSKTKIFLLINFQKIFRIFIKLIVNFQELSLRLKSAFTS